MPASLPRVYFALMGSYSQSEEIAKVFAKDTMWMPIDGRGSQLFWEE